MRCVYFLIDMLLIFTWGRGAVEANFLELNLLSLSIQIFCKQIKRERKDFKKNQTER